MAFCGLVEEPAEEGEGLEHIRLVNAGQPTANTAACLAAFGEAERELEQALGGPARDHHGLARLIFGDNALAHRGEQALGRFPDDDEIDAALLRADNRTWHARNQSRRPHAGIEIE